MLTTNRQQTSSKITLVRGLLGLLCLALVTSLGWAVVTLPTSASGLANQVQAALDYSGVTHPVTAVLLNFRSYDTLLEIGVLVLAVFCVWSLPQSPAWLLGFSQMAAGPVLGTLVRLLVPLMVVVSSYLLWQGGHAPGGAFQGGAVLGAVWVLLLLAGLRPFLWLHGWPMRTALVLGFAVFLAVAVGVMMTRGHLLEYPHPWAKDLILLIEAMLTLSIAFILAALFLGGPPQGSPAGEPTARAEQRR